MDLSVAYQKLLSNPLAYFVVLPTGEVVDADHTYRYIVQHTAGIQVLAILPGSFNPLHAGHRAIFDSIPHHSGWGLKMFEISVNRWGKEPLALDVLAQRLEQFRDYAPVLVTNAARFIDKCAILRPHHNQLQWHVGVDTIRRMRDDYGEIGLMGLPGLFHVYDRKAADEVERYPLDFKHFPSNVFRASYQVPDHLLGISSTKIRNGVNA